jgi:hypothetical protein
MEHPYGSGGTRRGKEIKNRTVVVLIGCPTRQSPIMEGILDQSSQMGLDVSDWGRWSRMPQR